MRRGVTRSVAAVTALCAALMVGPATQAAVAQTEPSPPPTYPYPECSPSLSALVLLALAGRTDLPAVILYIQLTGGKPSNCVVIVPEGQA